VNGVCLICAECDGPIYDHEPRSGDMHTWCAMAHSEYEEFVASEYEEAGPILDENEEGAR
jgi:hypothetical protein